jgi:hypothetical protein
MLTVIVPPVPPGAEPPVPAPLEVPPLPPPLVVPPLAPLPPLLVVPPFPVLLVVPPVAPVPPLLVVPPVALDVPPVVPPAPDFAPLESSSLVVELPPHATADPKTTNTQAPTIEREKASMLSP